MSQSLRERDKRSNVGETGLKILKSNLQPEINRMCTRIEVPRRRGVQCSGANLAQCIM